jgi:beta-glucosidase
MAVTELRRRDAALDLGITLNLTVADPVDAAVPADLDAARRIDGQFNRWFLDPLLRGSYPADVVEDFRGVDAAAAATFEAAVRPGDLETISTPIDTLGVNYYHGEYVGGSPPVVPVADGDAPTDRPIQSPFPAHEDLYWHDRGLARTPMNWEVQPEGLTRLLNRVSDEYTARRGIRLFITENGAAYDDVAVTEDGETRVHDDDRVEFVRGHLAAVLDAIEDGVDVRGYFYWSLLDNYEWAWGYEKRFGIVRVDYETQERSVKDSGREYSRIIAERALDLAPATP